ncbi:hypothetical protein [Brachybacterium sacelli]|uniref:Uncharacterized protein n=1 Tax=Brachybacterium sacelli TaxID=173364 RepID=A0ABS4WZ06_9MICO|nr:hypothetical protein [Brachybacterium sacelli]MBP2381326.1 hypothetical protein [Brachybacterium sacelli]
MPDVTPAAEPPTTSPTPAPEPSPAAEAAPVPGASPTGAGAVRALDLVRARFPRTPEEDETGLREHAAHLAALRAKVDAAPLRGREAAMTFDPRQGTS